ncbi:hypothetical protein HZS_2435 [Henneguya salminicola]|nr:hypothetical protein HZS_2435 [Henneguya salminicola]
MALLFSVIFILLAFIIQHYYRILFPKGKAYRSDHIEQFSGSIAFFHPFCNDCGGGERVLWFMISAIQNKFPSASIKIFTCDSTTANLIINKSIERFNVSLDTKNIEFLFLTGKNWILPSSWPHFTLFGQSLGSIILSIEAVRNHPIPDILIDTTGFVFFGAFFKLFGCHSVGAYIHYPTISTDMINRVTNRLNPYNNAKIFSKFYFVTYFKLIYYKIFFYWYKLGGYSVNFAMTNSKWTQNHICNLWKARKNRSIVVYPPCSPHFFTSHDNKSLKMLSISQFRPEKDHKKQIYIFAQLIKEFAKDSSTEKLLFSMAGSTRSDMDVQYLETLKTYAKELKVYDRMEFKINLPFIELKELMSESLIGLHTMNQEHFGIGIVEMMASGIIMIAHNSGGPKSDIIVKFNKKEVGFLAESIDQYVTAIKSILDLDGESIDIIRMNSILSVYERFSDKQFEQNVIRIIEKLILVL